MVGKSFARMLSILLDSYGLKIFSFRGDDRIEAALAIHRLSVCSLLFHCYFDIFLRVAILFQCFSPCNMRCTGLARLSVFFATTSVLARMVFPAFVLKKRVLGSCLGLGVLLVFHLTSHSSSVFAFTGFFRNVVTSFKVI